MLDRAPGTVAALGGFPLDDAWIHMVYARALVVEGGLHYNPGVAETGMTSPLWVVLLAGVYRPLAGLGVPAVVLGAKLLALAFGVAGAAVMVRLGALLGMGEGAAILAGCLFALDPSLTFSRAAGMEAPLFTFLVLLSLLLALRWRTVGAAATIGLAMVARPEGVLLVPALALLLARPGRAKARRLAWAAILASVPPLLYAAFCLYATGAPLPNTFYIKITHDPAVALVSFILGVRDYVHGNLPYFALESGTVMALIGAAAILRRVPLAGIATLGGGACLFLGTLASRQFSSGHYFYWERWLVPSFPFLLLAIAAGWDEVISALRMLVTPRGPGAPPLPARAVVTAVTLAAAVALGMPTARLMPALADRADTFAWNCQNMEETDVALGHWVDTHLPPDAVVAVQDAGALRYFGRRVTVDLVGLNDHRIRMALARGRLREFLQENRVRWFVIFPAPNPHLIARLGLVLIQTARAAHYTVTSAPQDEVAVYRWDPDARAGPTSGPPSSRR